MEEIERKFLLDTLPPIPLKGPLRQERYFLRIEGDVEERIQKKGDAYSFERKVRRSALSRETERRALAEGEFERMKPDARPIIRDSYEAPGIPGLSIKRYHGRFEGLIRAEIEFRSEKEAAAFVPFPWMGKEITGTGLGNDASLWTLSEDEFAALIPPR